MGKRVKLLLLSCVSAHHGSYPLRTLRAQSCPHGRCRPLVGPFEEMFGQPRPVWGGIPGLLADVCQVGGRSPERGSKTWPACAVGARIWTSDASGSKFGEEAASGRPEASGRRHEFSPKS